MLSSVHAAAVPVSQGPRGKTYEDHSEVASRPFWLRVLGHRDVIHGPVGQGIIDEWIKLRAREEQQLYPVSEGPSLPYIHRFPVRTQDPECNEYLHISIEKEHMLDNLKDYCPSSKGAFVLLFSFHVRESFDLLAESIATIKAHLRNHPNVSIIALNRERTFMSGLLKVSASEFLDFTEELPCKFDYYEVHEPRWAHAALEKIIGRVA